MRVLIVDQDSTTLEAIARALGDYFHIDTVTSKADCLDLLRREPCDVIISCEKLEDGSGLELLGQIGKRWPDTLRLFAAERSRLKLLKGRLGPFDLFRTLTYPLNATQLLSALTAASAAQGFEVPESEPDSEPDEPVARTETSKPGSRAKALLSGSAAPAPRAPGLRTPGAARSGAGTSSRGAISGAGTSSRASDVRTSNSKSIPVSSAAAVRPSSPGRVPASNLGPTPDLRTPARKIRSAQPSTSVGFRVPSSPSAMSDVRIELATPVPTPRAGRLGGQRQRLGARPGVAKGSRRGAFLVGAGAIAVLAIGGLAILILNLRQPADPAQTSITAIAHQPHYPPEVTELVADTEAAFEKDDYRRARTNIEKLRDIAPDHPRLAFLESLLNKQHGRSPASDAIRQEAPASASEAPPVVSRPEPVLHGPSHAAPTSARVAPSAAHTTAHAKSSTRGAPAASSQRAPSSATRVVSTATHRPTSQHAAVGVVASSRRVANPVEHKTNTSVQRAAAAKSLPIGAVPGVTAGAAAGSATLSDAPASASASTPDSAHPSGSTFSGRTLEDSAAGMGEPRLLRRVEPDYPTEAARRGVEGYVDVRFIVDPDGNVSNLSVIGSNPPELFDRSALAAVRRWKYDPKKINGAPVASRQQVRVQFKLVH